MRKRRLALTASTKPDRRRSDEIPPARSAQGKYIAWVYYVETNSSNVLRYLEPGDTNCSQLCPEQAEECL